MGAGKWNVERLQAIYRQTTSSLSLSFSCAYHKRDSKGKKRAGGFRTWVSGGKRMGFDETMADRWRTEDGGRRTVEYTAS